LLSAPSNQRWSRFICAINRAALTNGMRQLFDNVRQPAASLAPDQHVRSKLFGDVILPGTAKTSRFASSAGGP
jgi:hypothetical protein